MRGLASSGLTLRDLEGFGLGALRTALREDVRTELALFAETTLGVVVREVLAELPRGTNNSNAPQGRQSQTQLKVMFPTGFDADLGPMPLARTGAGSKSQSQDDEQAAYASQLEPAAGGQGRDQEPGSPSNARARQRGARRAQAFGLRGLASHTVVTLRNEVCNEQPSGLLAMMEGTNSPRRTGSNNMASRPSRRAATAASPGTPKSYDLMPLEVNGGTSADLQGATNSRLSVVTESTPSRPDASSYTPLMTAKERTSESPPDDGPIDEAPGPRVVAPQDKRSLREMAREMVQSTHFEHLVGFMVLANALALGFETDYWARHPKHADGIFTRVSEALFCVIFTCELLLRLFVYRGQFFAPGNLAWNIFDMMLVMVQVLHQGIQLIFMVFHQVHMHSSLIRLLSILRVIRVLRLVRAVHLFTELRVMVSSVGRSVSTLLWSMVLLGGVIYMVSLTIMQVTLGSGETVHHKRIEYWFGSVPRTLLTLFECIVGGVSWDEVVSPLVTDISPLMGIVFAGYVAVCFFAMMNLVTGAFVEKAMQAVREDKDMVLAKRISEVFLGSDEGEEVTWDDFRMKLGSPALQDYFKQIDVDVSEARALFELIDVDGSGSVSSGEIVDGCLRLRGPARSLDLALMCKDLASMYQVVLELKDIFELRVQGVVAT